MNYQLIWLIGVLLSCFVTNCIIFDFLDKMHSRIYTKKAPYLLSYFIFTGVIIGINCINIPLLNILSYVIITGLIGYFLYADGMMGLLINEIFVLCLAFCEEIAITLVSLIYVLLSEGQISLIFRDFLNIAFSQVIIIFVYRVFINLIRKVKFNHLSKIQYLLFSIFPVFSILCIFTLMTFSTGSTMTIILTLLTIITVIILNLYFNYLFEFISKNNELKNELNLFQQQADFQYHYYDNLEEKYKQSRKLQHDMRNHLQLLEQLYKSKEEPMADQYAKNIYEMIDALGQKYFTENKVLNIIMNDKMQIAESNQVMFECEIGEIDIDFISSIDLTTIFSNLLDNAIEASAKRKENRVIKIKIEPFHDFTNINIKNSFEEIPIKKGNKYISTKAAHDAVGIPNVIMTVEKYGGNFRTEIDKNTFIVNIIIPSCISNCDKIKG